MIKGQVSIGIIVKVVIAIISIVVITLVLRGAYTGIKSNLHFLVKEEIGPLISQGNITVREDIDREVLSFLNSIREEEGWINTPLSNLRDYVIIIDNHKKEIRAYRTINGNPILYYKAALSTKTYYGEGSDQWSIESRNYEFFVLKGPKGKVPTEEIRADIKVLNLEEKYFLTREGSNKVLGYISFSAIPQNPGSYATQEHQ